MFFSNNEVIFLNKIYRLENQQLTLIQKFNVWIARKNFVVENLRKKMYDSNMNGSQFAEKIDMPEAKFNKILNGKQNLKVDEISEIARKLQMREIDLFTYPEKYYPVKQRR